MDKKATRLAAAFMLTMYLIGVILFVFFPESATTPYLSEIFLFVTNSLVLYSVFRINRQPLFIYWSVFIFILTFFIEVAGVATGLVFGEYAYGPAMMIKLFKVPVIIAYNWLMVIFGAVGLAVLIIRNRYLAPLISAAIVILFDYIMEPVAIELEFWNWSGGNIPLRNYAAWGLISYFSSFLLLRIKYDTGSPLARLLILLQIVFFLLLGFLLK